MPARKTQAKSQNMNGKVIMDDLALDPDAEDKGVEIRMSKGWVAIMRSANSPIVQKGLQLESKKHRHALASADEDERNRILNEILKATAVRHALVGQRGLVDRAGLDLEIDDVRDRLMHRKHADMADELRSAYQQNEHFRVSNLEDDAGNS